MKIRITAFAVLLLLAMTASADDTAAEIDHLLTTIGSSDCTFIRNGKRHSAENAEDHLRMKYKRGRRYATSTEAFIERLASKSSMTRKAYMIECPGVAPEATAAWLTQRLEELRGN